MGQLLSRVRKKPATDDVLKELEKELQTLEEHRRGMEHKKKRLVGTLIFYSIVIYVIAVVAIYCYWFSSNYQKRILFAVPLVTFPFLMWGLKLLLQWIFQRRLETNLEKLTELHKKKRTILNDVKETETYSKAKEILEKYDPEFKKQLQMEKEAAEKAEELKNLRRRSLGPATGAKRPIPNISRTQTPGRPNMPPLPGPNNGQLWGRPPGPPLPRPILPRETGVFDKFVDYVVGDGPSNRFALICQHCCSHNGMALKEEFEYLAFRCCYCYNLNPPKKLRPFAPRLPEPEALSFEEESSTEQQSGENVTSTVSDEQTAADTEIDNCLDDTIAQSDTTIEEPLVLENGDKESAEPKEPKTVMEITEPINVPDDENTGSKKDR